MSTQRGNVKKSGPPKHQNKTAWKNVYHDTSKRTQQIVNTEVSGVCQRCKDIIDWKIRYKKYKPLSQPKTCVTCKQKTVKKAYNTYCQGCSEKEDKCAKCGERKEIIMQPSLPTAKQASEDRLSEFELELLPERKRRTVLRRQEKGLPNPQFRGTDDSDQSESECDSENNSDSECVTIQSGNTAKCEEDSVKPIYRIDQNQLKSSESGFADLDLNKE